MWEELATLSASFWIQTFRSQTYSKLRFYSNIVSCTKEAYYQGYHSASRVVLHMHVNAYGHPGVLK
ncbi:hypothetical protein KSF_036740 [Reticulibacter mediterranei]|uniref:Uncharacterized protein n=1 Tax=Reticulibacter mediterranei TaxID=2778369 RepID=A0A8J3IFL6_9CHLR|nr:hypothetical protein KSF_036740 [Reticulibacter mediterranei]